MLAPQLFPSNQSRLHQGLASCAAQTTDMVTSPPLLFVASSLFLFMLHFTAVSLFLHAVSTCIAVLLLSLDTFVLASLVIEYIFCAPDHTLEAIFH